jgi:nucleoside-diphosphate-sugar epimerase
MDIRGLRFPGLISYKAQPGGGTTDYAVHIYYEAAAKGKYTSYIASGSFMDMMYMPDALESIVELMEADPSKLKHRCAFNISAMSVDPEAITASIRTKIPNFELSYEVDPVRQAIADSWPDSLDCSAAREEWGFSPKYDLDAMTVDMLEKIN